MVPKMRKEVSLYFFPHFCPYGRNLTCTCTCTCTCTRTRTRTRTLGVYQYPAPPRGGPPGVREQQRAVEPGAEHREDPPLGDVDVGRAQHRVPGQRGRCQDVERGQVPGLPCPRLYSNIVLLVNPQPPFLLSSPPPLFPRTAFKKRACASVRKSLDMP